MTWTVTRLASTSPGPCATTAARRTPARVRGLGLPQFAIDALRRHRAEQAAARLAAGDRREDNDLVFFTRLGRPLAYANVGRALKQVCAKAGIEDAAKRVPYEMRHTYASLQ